MVASHRPPTRDVAHNPGVCPDWESNWNLLDRGKGPWAGAQSTEPRQPGQKHRFIVEHLKNIKNHHVPSEFRIPELLQNRWRSLRSHSISGLVGGNMELGVQ